MKKTAARSSYLWFGLPVLPVLAAYGLLGADAPILLLWWFSMSAIGWLVWPLAISLFPGDDGGSLFARPLGMALGGFVVWTLSYVRVLPFRRLSIILILLLLGAFAWVYRRGWQKAIRVLDKPANIRRIAAGEFLFAAGLVFWSFARGLKPELDSLEKFMNIGFMNSLWRTDYLPALDMWYAGGSINYYYYGQYSYTFLAKLTGIRPEIAYNLGMATTFALALSLGYAVGDRLIALIRRHEPRLSSIWQSIGGLTSAFLITLAGNAHAFFYADNGPGRGILAWALEHGWIEGEAGGAFWFADSTRFIGYNPDTVDKTIHEFPYYSFLVADLHAHVINLALVLLFMGLLTSLLDRPHLLQAAAACRTTGPVSSMPDEKSRLAVDFSPLLNRLKAMSRDGLFWLFAILLSLFMMGNYWDFAIYFAVITIILMVTNARGFGQLICWRGLAVFSIQCILILFPFLRATSPWSALALFAAAFLINSLLTLVVSDALTLTGVQISWLFFFSHLLALPFNSSFEPISKTIALTVSHTPVWQLLILWGPHLLAGIILLVYLVKRGTGSMRSREIPVDSLRSSGRISRLDRFILNRNPGDLLLLAMLICAVGLIVLPELVYVVDIYSGDYKRSNTMFKFTYQAFVLLSLVWGCGLARIAGHQRRPAAARFAEQSDLLTPEHDRIGELVARSEEFAIRRDRLPSILAASALTLMLLMPGWYPTVATEQWLGTFTRDRYQSLDGLKLFAEKDSSQIGGQAAGELAPDYAAIQWFQTQVSGQPVILEAFGSSYTDECRISAFTGLPTVMGWETHEWLWRTSKANPNAYGTVVLPRQDDVRTLYTTADQVVRRSLVAKYQIEYIVIGKIERVKFAENPDTENSPTLVRDDLLLELGQIIFSQDDLVVIHVQQPAEG